MNEKPQNGMRQTSVWREPEAVTQTLLALYLTGVCTRGYGYYNQTLKATPQVWMDVVHGTANAPEQYRVGVAQAAFWITQHSFHLLRLSQVFGIFDLVGSILGVLALYDVLRGSATYRQASGALRWFGSACFAALTFYFVDWSVWYQKATTFPTVFFVALMVWLWSPRVSETSAVEWRLPRWAIAAGLLALVGLQSFVRADIALMLCLGVLAASALRGSPLSLPRGAAVAVSAAGALLAAGVQLYLAKVLYPNATYAGVPVFMLRHDWWRLSMWASCLIFLAPVLWTWVKAMRQREPLEGAGAATLLAGAGYAALWITLGRLDEVRIFLPLALAIVPVTVELAMRSLRETP